MYGLLIIFCISEWLSGRIMAAGLDNTTDIIEGVEFGKMETFITTENSVYHLEIDLRDSNKLVFSDQHSIKEMDEGKNTTAIVGVANQSGYKTGRGMEARFNTIIGFLQINRTTLVVADSGNHCLRLVDRSTRQTSPFVGECEEHGYRDGLNAQFNVPFSVIRDPHSQHMILVSDFYNHVIRQVDIVSRNTITLIEQIAELYEPKGMAFDRHGRILYISSDHLIYKYDRSSHQLTKMTGSGRNVFQDGKFSEAQFQYPRDLIFLSEAVLLAVGVDSNRLRLINLLNESVSSICVGGRSTKDGTARECEMCDPWSVTVNGSKIYIAEEKAIRFIPFNFTCETNKTLTLTGDTDRAQVYWTSSSGDLVQVNLPQGDHAFSYSLSNQRQCRFTVNITGPEPTDEVDMMKVTLICTTVLAVCTCAAISAFSAFR